MEARTKDHQLVGDFVRKTFQSIISPFRGVRKVSPPIGSSIPSSTSTITYPHSLQEVSSSSTQLVNSTENTVCSSLHQLDVFPTNARPQVEAPGQVHGRACAQYTNSSSRIITVSDGESDCLALFLTRDFVGQLNELIQGNRRLAIIEEQLRSASFDAKNAELSMNQAKHLVEVAGNEAPIDGLQQDIAKLEPVLQEASDRRDRLESDTNVFQIEFRASQNQSLRLFERLFSEANLLISPETENQEVDRSSQEIKAVGDSQSEIPFDGSPFSQVNVSISSLEDSNRRAIYDQYLQARANLDQIQADFDNREEDCRTERLDYYQAVLQGNGELPKLSETELDLRQLQAYQGLTRDLILAEESYEVAVAQARAFNLLPTASDQESGFADREDDGYAESQEVPGLGTSKREFIEAWQDHVEESDDVHYLLSELKEDEKWDAKQVEIGSSISCVDDSRNKKRIDLWRAYSEELRANPTSSSA